MLQKSSCISFTCSLVSFIAEINYKILHESKCQNEEFYAILLGLKVESMTDNDEESTEEWDQDKLQLGFDQFPAWASYTVCQ